MPTGTIQAHGPVDPDEPPKKTYDVNIFGVTVLTTVTASPVSVNEWIDNIRSTHRHSPRLTVAIDTEQGPCEIQIGTLQLCVNSLCLVYQIFQTPKVPESLLEFLEDENILYVGFDIFSKLKKLLDVIYFEEKARFEDLGTRVAQWYGRPDLIDRSLNEFSRIVLGNNLEFQEMDDFDWNEAELSESQVLNACVSTSVVYQIESQLTARIQAHAVQDSNSPPKKTYDVFLFGKTIFTTVTASPEMVNEWIDDLRSTNMGYSTRHYVGFDVEKGPNEDLIGTLQLYSMDCCLVFQIVHSPSVPDSLARFLSDPKIVFFGLHIKSKLQMVQRVLTFELSAGYTELGNMLENRYGRPEMSEMSLVEISPIVRGGPLKLPEVGSDWNRLQLTEEQVLFACFNAYMSLEIVKQASDSNGTATPFR